jgi:hypothetical protein
MTAVTNIGDVKNALEALLSEWPEMESVSVEVHEPIPEDTGKHPWIGIFNVGQDLITRVLGGGLGNRKQNMDWAIFCAASDPSSGRKAGEALDQLMQQTLNALLSDTSIRGTALGIDERMTTAYLDFKFKNAQFTQVGMIKFTTLGNTY